MKKITVSLMLLLATIISAQENTISISDFQFLNGTKWEGTLMYINYSDGKEVNIPKKLGISIEKDKIYMLHRYPNEPKANTKSIIKIAKSGTSFGKEKIQVVERNTDGSILLKITTKGKDNGQKAQFLKTYILGKEDLEIITEGRLLTKQEGFVRNKTTLKKVSP